VKLASFNAIYFIYFFEKERNGGFDKKLVILITDGAPNGLFTLLDVTPNSRFAQITGADTWLVANEFKKQGITLVVVGVEPSVLPCDDFYCALAHKTGIKKLFILLILFSNFRWSLYPGGKC